MEATFDQLELLPNVERRTRSKSVLRQLMEATQEHGFLGTQSQVAAALGLSKQRVNQFVNEGRLPSIEIGGKKLVPIAALEFFIAEERKNGRPLKPGSLGSILRGAFQADEKS